MTATLFIGQDGTETRVEIPLDENYTIELAETIKNFLDITIVIPEGVTKLNEIKKSTRHVNTIVFPSTLENLPKMGWCLGLREIRLPPSITIIPAEFCKNCFVLEKINMENIKVIYDNAFFGTRNLKTVKLPLVQEIHERAFMYADLETIDMPVAKSIGHDAFRDCRFLSIITAPHISVLSEGAFNGCQSLKKIEFDKVTSVPKYCFRDCASLRRVSLKSVFDIGEQGFRSCNSLLSVDAPNITNIGLQAFFWCTQLKNIDISKLTKIDGSCFYQCEQLQHLEINKDVSSFSNPFYHAGMIRIPDNLTITVWFSSLDHLTSKLQVPNSLLFTLRDCATHCRIILEGELADAMDKNLDKAKRKLAFFFDLSVKFPYSTIRTITYLRPDLSVIHEHLVRKKDQDVVDTVIQSLQGLGLGGIVAETIVKNTGIFSSLTPPSRMYNFMTKKEEDEFRLTEEEVMEIDRKRRASTDEARAPKRLQLGSDKRGSDSDRNGAAKRRALDPGFRLSHIPASCFKRNEVQTKHRKMQV